MDHEDRMEKLVSLAKRRGFVYQGSEIYGGLAGTWDYGPVGTALKNNIKTLWWKRYVTSRKDIFGIDAAIIMNPKVWHASGHVSGFTDPLIECAECRAQFRADQLGEDGLLEKCPGCGTAGTLSSARAFQMMFETHVGARRDSASLSYLRPETAQGIFANYKNILDTTHPRIPFGIAQIGKAFRNEIAPRDFLFRSREFEQMEIEWFCRKENWPHEFETWQKEMREWIKVIGLDDTKVKEFEVPEGERAHYSERTIDFEYIFPFGVGELYGLAYRTDYDLSCHARDSGVDLTYFDQEREERFLPHVIEPSLGVDRTFLAVLDSAYTEEEVGGETRVVMKFVPALAPVTVAILPLMRKEELTKKATEVFDTLRTSFVCQYDETGSIGKRYRRQDEIGTPFSITVDYDTLEDDTVTVRDRDSMKQDRVAINELTSYIKEKLS